MERGFKMKDNYYSGHGDSGHDGYSAHDGHMDPEHCVPKKVDRGVKSKQMTLLPDETVPTFDQAAEERVIKVPVVLAERTLQIVVESDISLYPPATEIKRVKKHVFLDQVKLVPVEFDEIGTTNTFAATRAKLFVSGHIRKNIEYASADHNAPLQDRIAKVRFSGFAELNGADFITRPIFSRSDKAEANFVNDKTQIDARLDKYFFQNIVNYNEQPYGELLAARFYEIDYSPEGTYPDGSFKTLREKIALELSLKLLQVQQLAFDAERRVPDNSGFGPL